MNAVKRLGLAAALAAGLFGCREDKAPNKPEPSASAKSASKPAPSTPLSADVVTEASEEAPGVDAGPSVVASGMVDSAALRKRHVARLKSDTSPVTVLRGKSPLELGEAICQAVVPKVRWDTPVLLKPNLCGFDGLRDPAKSKGDDGLVGRTTHVDFTRGVVRCLKKRGFKRITISEEGRQATARSLPHGRQGAAPVPGLEPDAHQEAELPRADGLRRVGAGLT